MTALLVLHAVRLKGFADVPELAGRFALDPELTAAALRDHEARGHVTFTEFAGTGGWSLTEAGRTENERLLAADLDGPAVAETTKVHTVFQPLNGMLRSACTDWQLRPSAGDPLAANDHTDPAWDDGVLHELAVVDRALGGLNARLTAIRERFAGYDTRFGAALARARAGDPAYVDRTDVDSCHRVWFELHEDLVASLGLVRGTTPDR